MGGRGLRLPRLGRLFKGFRASRSGIGAVEFALIAPFLLLLYLGGSEITIAITINRKVEHTASTVSDLVAQASSLTADQLKGIYGISKAVLLPYASSGLKIRVTSVKIDATGITTVDWSCPTVGMAVLNKGAKFTLPAQFAALRERTIIVAETLFPYSPLTGLAFTGKIEMGGTSYLDPRVGSSVASTGCAPIAL